MILVQVVAEEWHEAEHNQPVAQQPNDIEQCRQRGVDLPGPAGKLGFTGARGREELAVFAP